MTKASDNEYPSVYFEEQAAAPGTPSTGFWRLYFKSGGLYHEDDAGTEVGPLSGSATASTYVGAKAYNSTTQNINNTTAALTFNSEEFDTDGFHDTGSNTSRMTIPTGKGGKYLLQAGSFASASTDYMFFRVDGTTTVRGGQTFARATTGYQQCQAIVSLNAGQYVEIMIGNTSSINYGHASLLDAQSWFAVTLLT